MLGSDHLGKSEDPKHERGRRWKPEPQVPCALPKEPSEEYSEMFQNCCPGKERGSMN